MIPASWNVSHNRHNTSYLIDLKEQKIQINIYRAAESYNFIIQKRYQLAISGYIGTTLVEQDLGHPTEGILQLKFKIDPNE